MENLKNVQKERKEEKISEDAELGIPPIPAPKKQPPIPINKKKIPKKFRKEIKELKDKGQNPLLVKCKRCNEHFLVSIPDDDLNFADEKSLAVVFVHENEKDKGRKHALLFEVDRAHNISLLKTADVIMTSKDDQYINEEEKSQGYKIVGVYCRICESLVHLHVPKSLLENSPLSKIPVVYIHKKKKEQKAHGLIIFIDRFASMRDHHLADVLIGR
ncbi:MAG: hypothetical protein R6U96_14395 [Promethearchaeia archaeon]